MEQNAFIYPTLGKLAYLQQITVKSDEKNSMN